MFRIKYICYYSKLIIFIKINKFLFKLYIIKYNIYENYILKLLFSIFKEKFLYNLI